jgi:hypothetical protein
MPLHVAPLSPVPYPQLRCPHSGTVHARADGRRRQFACSIFVRCNAGRFAARESDGDTVVQNLFTNPLTRITVEIT